MISRVEAKRPAVCRFGAVIAPAAPARSSSGQIIGTYLDIYALQERLRHL